MLNRYILDANVLVSAVLFPNSTANLAYQKALDTGILLISVETFSEYKNVIFRPKFDRYVSVERRQLFLGELRAVAGLVPILELTDDCRDAKDNKYLDVAINGMANVLITGDQDLLILHPYRGILPILSPSDFLKGSAFTQLF
ncbi:MAG: putative toxin-antitoxin system toxin component, PIN family [Snowella sp.]